MAISRRKHIHRWIVYEKRLGYVRRLLYLLYVVGGIDETNTLVATSS